MNAGRSARVCAALMLLQGTACGEGATGANSPNAGYGTVTAMIDGTEFVGSIAYAPSVIDGAVRFVVFDDRGDLARSLAVTVGAHCGTDCATGAGHPTKVDYSETGSNRFGEWSSAYATGDGRLVVTDRTPTRIAGTFARVAMRSDVIGIVPDARTISGGTFVVVIDAGLSR